jgi:hypothetical protein
LIGVVLDRERQQLMRHRFGANATAIAEIRTALTHPGLPAENLDALRSRLAELPAEND